MNITLERKRAVRALLCIGFALLLSAFVVSPAAISARNDKFSSYDESTHLDNAWRWSHFDIPQKGERISPEILSEWTCRGFYDSNVDFPPCTAVENISGETFPISLSNYNTKHPPLYYIVNGFIGRALVALTPVDSFVSAVRIANSVWVLAVIVIANWTFTTLNVRKWPKAALTALAVLIPVAFWRWTYANNDVASYASAWLIAWAGIRATKVGLKDGLPALIVASVIGTLTKGFTIGAVAAVTIALTPTALLAASTASLRVRAASRLLLPGLFGSLCVVGWLAFHRLHQSDIPYAVPFIRTPPDGVPWGRISEQIVRISAPVGGLPGWIYSSSPFLNTAYVRWLELVAWALSMSAAVLILDRTPRTKERMTERAFGVATLLSPPLLAALIISYNLLDGSPAFIRVIDRYYISVLPYFIISLAMVMATRRRFSIAVASVLMVGVGLHLSLYTAAVL